MEDKSHCRICGKLKEKKHIKYVNIDEQEISEDSGLMSPNVNITTQDMHEFIETLPMVSYRLIDDVEKGKDETYYGFLAQEILYSKVGSELVTVPTIEEQELVGDKLRYSETKYISFIEISNSCAIFIDGKQFFFFSIYIMVDYINRCVNNYLC